MGLTARWDRVAAASLRSSSTSGFRAWFQLRANGSLDRADDPGSRAAPGHRCGWPHGRRTTSCPLSIGYGRDKDGSSEGQGLALGTSVSTTPAPAASGQTSTLGARLDTRQRDARQSPFPLCDVGGLWPPPRAAESPRF